MNRYTYVMRPVQVQYTCRLIPIKALFIHRVTKCAEAESQKIQKSEILRTKKQNCFLSIVYPASCPIAVGKGSNSTAIQDWINRRRWTAGTDFQKNST